jgi:hypothetical protein
MSPKTIETAKDPRVIPVQGPGSFVGFPSLL